jgi:hypothetical protein
LAKDLIEGVIKKTGFEEPSFFFIAGQANFELGYSLIAEKNYMRLMEYPEYEAIACKQLGYIF